MNKPFFYAMETDEIDEGMDSALLVNGWDYDENYLGEGVIGLSVKSPSGKAWSLDECLEVLDKKPVFGDAGLIEAIKVFDFYNLLYNWAFKGEKEKIRERGLI